LVNKTVIEQPVRQGFSNTKQLEQLRTMACSLEVTKQHPSMSCLSKTGARTGIYCSTSV